MTWLIAIAVLGFMLAPLIWIIPTPRQARQAKLREHARKLGLQVQVLALPQTRRQKVRREKEYNGVCYALNLGLRKPRPAWRYWFAAEHAADDDAVALPETVQVAIDRQRKQWPGDALVLEFNGQSLRLYWFERGLEFSTVEQLAGALKQLAEDLHYER